MGIQIDPQIIIDIVEKAVNFGLSLAWSVIDRVVFIELENPLGEVAIFVAVVSALIGGIFGFRWLKEKV